MSKYCLALVLAGLLATGETLADGVRNYVYIVGSSTLQPFAAAVADKIAKGGKILRPKIESTGTGGGFTLFCDGVGMDFPDIVNASRPMKKKEFDNCQKNGVNDIVEVKIGYDGIVVAQSKKSKPYNLTIKQLYLALAKQIPDPACKQPRCEKLVANPYQTWKQIDPALPDVRIEALGPPVSSGTSEAFADIVLAQGCDSYPWLAAKKTNNETEYKQLCHSLREDGAYTEETVDTIVSRLTANPEAIAIVGYSGLKENTDRIQAAAIEGVLPNHDNIASRQYPLYRPLSFYLKKAHDGRVPGLEKYLAEFTNEKAWGEKGYLVAKGLISMPLPERKTYASDAKTLKSMTLEETAPSGSK